MNLLICLAKKLCSLIWNRDLVLEGYLYNCEKKGVLSGTRIPVYLWNVLCNLGFVHQGALSVIKYRTGRKRVFLCVLKVANLVNLGKTNLKSQRKICGRIFVDRLFYIIMLQRDEERDMKNYWVQVLIERGRACPTRFLIFLCLSKLHED